MTHVKITIEVVRGDEEQSHSYKCVHDARIEEEQSVATAISHVIEALANDQAYDFDSELVYTSLACECIAPDDANPFVVAAQARHDQLIAERKEE